MLIRLGATTHSTRAIGVTICGERYPATWRHQAKGTVNCPDCRKLLDKEQEAMYATFRRGMEPAPGMEDMSW